MQSHNAEQIRLLCCPKTFLTRAVQDEAVTNRALNGLLPPPLLPMEASRTARRPAASEPRSTVTWSLERPPTVPATVCRTMKGEQP